MFIDPKRIPATGSPLLDRAHERLAHVVNRAYEQWRDGQPHHVYMDTLAEFMEMLEDHFREEVQIIRAAGFDRVEEHMGIHAELTKRLKGLLADLAAEKTDVGVPDAFTFIDRILYEHEFLDDQEFWGCFQKGVEAGVEPNEPLLAWSDELSIGDHDIDRQHQALVKLLNRLRQALESRAPAEEIAAQLGEIKRHTEWHFRYEEGLMDEHDLKGADAHKMLHESLLADLDDVVADFSGGKYDQLEDLLQNYLKFWLLDHITHVDRGLGRTLDKARARHAGAKAGA